jgi:hypothetical protein
MENSLKLAPNEATGSNPIEEEDLTDYVSSDPLNRVLDPVAGSHRPGSNAKNFSTSSPMLRQNKLERLFL